MKKDEKKQKAEALHQELEKSRTVILSDFEGITVAQDFDLRRRIAQVGAKYKVVKNRLIERASQGTPLEPAARELSGTTSLAYTQEDPVALAKVLTAYAKENPILKFKSGVVEGRVVSMADLSTVANLPAKEELLSKSLFLINAPARHVVLGVAGVARKLAVVIQQAVQLKKFGAQDSAANSKAEQGTVEQGSTDAYRAIEHAIDHVFNGPPEFREEHGRGFLSELRAPQVDPHNFDDALPHLRTGGRISPGGPGLAPSVLDLARELSVSQREKLRQHYLKSLKKFEEDFSQDTLGGT